MPKIIEIKAPGPRSTFQAEGYVVYLPIGDRRVKCLVQTYIERRPCLMLTHYASGRTLGDLAAVKRRHSAARGGFTDRDAALELIEDLEHEHGAARLLAAIDAAPVLN